MVYQVTQEEDRILMELKEIFKYLDSDVYDRIPDKYKNLVESYNGQYKFIYDKTKSLNDQDVLQKTKDSIIYIFYSIATPEEREIINKNINKYEEVKSEEEAKREKYSYDKLFENTNVVFDANQSNEQKKIDTNETAIAKIEKKSIITKIINKIKSIFSKKG